MSTVKISQLPFTSAVCNTALIPIVQDGTTCATYACKLGSTVLIEGSGTASIQRNGFSNSASGAYSIVTQGLANIAGNCFTTANGTNNIVCTSNSHVLSGQMNVIACDARPNVSSYDQIVFGPTSNSGSGGYYNGFAAGQTTLDACFGDLTTYYTPGSTVSSICVYDNPQPVYTNLVVCGSSYNAGTCETTICVDPTINTGSGYIIKTSTFSSYSAYHPNTIAGGAFNTINGYTSASTISGGYLNTVSGGYGTIAGGMFNEVYKSGFVGGGSANVSAGVDSGIASGTSNLIGDCSNVGFGGDYSFIGGGNANRVFGSCSSIVGGQLNIICVTGNFSFIGGGSNVCVSGGHSTVSGGYTNVVSGNCSGILGGESNTASCAASFIVGSNITTDRACTTFVNNLSIKNIPTAAAGLPSGSVWSNGGVLTIVP